MKNSVNILINHLPYVSATNLFTVNEPMLHRHRHVPVNTLIFVSDGTLYVKENGINYTIPKNNIMFFKANAVQEGYKYIFPGSKWFYINFTVANTADCYSTKDLRTLPKTLFYPKFNELHQVLHHMIELYTSNDPLKQQKLNHALYGILVDILSIQYQKNTNNLKQKIAPKVIKILEEFIDTEFSANIIGNKLNMNYSYISRKFKQETGTTIKHQYLTLKINKAIFLLQTTQLNIAEISQQLNFPNPYYFSRVFKQITGISPSEYRQQVY